MSSNCSTRKWLAWLAAVAVGCLFSTGCAAFHPIHGIPARYLPEELRGDSRAGKRTIDLSLLKQPQHPHLVDTGDVLGIYIEGVLGSRQQPQPVNIPLGTDEPPSFGFPIPVRDDGTISLPLIGTVNVRGKTIGEVEDFLKKAYTSNKRFLNPENDRILVSLQKSRQYRVLVIRQESTSQQNFAGVGQINLGTMKRGTGQVVSLPAYKNDVLTALAKTGGLPGLDAENAIYVIRRRKPANDWTPAPSSTLPETHPGEVPADSPTAPTPASGSTEARRRSKSFPIFRGQSPWNDPGQNAVQNVPDWQADYRNAPLPQKTTARNPYTMNAGRMSNPPAGPTFNSQPQPDFSQYPTDNAQYQAGAQYQTEPSNQSAPPMWNAPMSAPAVTDGYPEVNSPEASYPTADPVMMTPEEFGWQTADLEANDRRIIKIPVRLGPGETVDLQEDDVILEDGDIVFIESRDTEVFYTGGLLGGGQFTLPRDYDLNVLQAIAVAQGQRVGAVGGASRGTQSLGGQSALNSDVSISASRVVILRYLEDGRMFPIEINLYKARTDVAEQVIVQPGDYILLQYTKLEAVAAFFERHLLEGAFFGLAAAQLNSTR